MDQHDLAVAPFESHISRRSFLHMAGAAGLSMAALLAALE
jgi:hypothetical protein